MRPVFNPPSPTPRHTLIEVYWQLRGPDERFLVCAFYRMTGGVAVHVGYIGEDPVHVSEHRDISRARDWADDLRAQLIEESGCEQPDTEEVN